MSSFLTELRSTQKPYPVPFKEISLSSSFVKSFDTLPRHKIIPTYVIISLRFKNICYI